MSFYKEVPGRQTTLESTLKFDTEPKAGSTNPVTSEGVKGAIGKSTNDVLDDHDHVDITISDTGRAFYDDHELGYYYQVGDKIWLCTEHTRSGGPGSYTYNTTLTKQNGIVPVLNDFVEKMKVIAHALDTLDARLSGVEDAVIDQNIGERIADSLDVQSLKIGGVNISQIFKPISE